MKDSDGALRFAAQLIRIHLTAVPLADIEVTGFIDAHIVAVFENRFTLEQDLKLAVAIFRGVTAGARDYPVLIVENRDKPALLPHAVVTGFSSETDTGVEMAAVNDRSADIGAREVHATHRLALEGKPIKLVPDAFGT